MSTSESLIPHVGAPNSSKKRKHNEISQDAPPAESDTKEPLSLNELPTEITTMIYNYLDENSAVLLSLTTKKLHADYIFAIPSPPKHNLDRMCIPEPIDYFTAYKFLWAFLRTWIGPNYHYNETSNTFLNNNIYPPSSREEYELERRYKDYHIRQQLLPRPYEMHKEDWENECKRVIQRDGLEKLSYTNWLQFWEHTDVFQRIRRERGFLTGNRADGAHYRRKWGEKKKKRKRRSEV